MKINLLQTALSLSWSKKKKPPRAPDPVRLRQGRSPRLPRSSPVGPGGNVDGKDVEMIVKVGDKVLTSKYSGTEVKVDGEECTIVRQSDILAIVE